MKKINSILISVMLFISLFSFTAFAESAEMDYAAIDDGANLFTQAEEEKLLATIMEFKEVYNFDVTLVTRETTNGVDVLDYADDYEMVDDYSDGLVFLLNTGTREYVTSTRNLAETIFNEAAFDEVDNEVVSFLQDGDYYGAFNTVLEITEDVLVADSVNEVYAPKFDMFAYVMSLLRLGLVSGILFAAIVAGFYKKSLVNQMNTAKLATDANTYAANSFNLTSSSDRFLHKHTTRSPINNNSSGSSSSRTRTSMNSRGMSRTSRKGGY